MNKTTKISIKQVKYNVSEKDYEIFKKSIRPMAYFKGNLEEASAYYQEQLSMLLYLSGRSLELLISEFMVAQHPTIPAILAQELLNIIDRCQDLSF